MGRIGSYVQEVNKWVFAKKIWLIIHHPFYCISDNLILGAFENFCYFHVSLGQE